MRKFVSFLSLLIALTVSAQEQDMAFVQMHFVDDTTTASAIRSSSVIKNEFAGFRLPSLVAGNKATKKLMGYSKQGQPIALYYFPGSSAKKALVIGGVHGSELSAVEVAKELIRQLEAGAKPYYSVIIIPTLFPDNAAVAEGCRNDRVLKNAGRYTTADAIDPNRQMPALGKPFYVDNPVDAFGREIEKENRLLLQLIQAYAPERIINLHAIKDLSKAGVYADPRTDCDGRAAGFSSDSTLAVLMAGYIDGNGGAVPGNKIKTSPTALYYLDPKPSPVGVLQPRNLSGMNMQGKIAGVSLGSWASTAVCDEANEYSRPAMRLFTMEFPGYKKPSEYGAGEREWFSKQVILYAASIYRYFLQNFCTEEPVLGGESLVRN